MAAPAAAVVDSQSVRAAVTLCQATRGWDGGKKVAGRKRHIVVDTMGPLSAVLVTPASMQDRVAARSLPRRMRATIGGRVVPVWVDGAYTAPCSTGHAGHSAWWWRSSNAHRCRTSPRCHRRWVVERSLAWITGHHRCVHDYERLPRHHEAVVRWSVIRITGRRLTRHHQLGNSC